MVCGSCRRNRRLLSRLAQVQSVCGLPHRAGSPLSEVEVGQLLERSDHRVESYRLSRVVVSPVFQKDPEPAVDEQREHHDGNREADRGDERRDEI